MREIRLRHHHLLCTVMFSGHGYDRRFVENMERVVSSLRSPDGLTVRLSNSCDDICSFCPNETGGYCRERDSVLGKDRSAVQFLGLREDLVLPAGPLMEHVREKLSGLADIGTVCGDCEWANLCNERLRIDRIEPTGPGETREPLVPFDG